MTTGFTWTFHKASPSFQLIGAARPTQRLLGHEEGSEVSTVFRSADSIEAAIQIGNAVMITIMFLTRKNAVLSGKMPSMMEPLADVAAGVRSGITLGVTVTGRRTTDGAIGVMIIEGGIGVAKGIVMIMTTTVAIVANRSARL